MGQFWKIPHNADKQNRKILLIQGHPESEEGRRQIFDLCDIEGKEKLTFSDLRKISDAMKYNLSDDAIQ